MIPVDRRKENDECFVRLWRSYQLFELSLLIRFSQEYYLLPFVRAREQYGLHNNLWFIGIVFICIDNDILVFYTQYPKFVVLPSSSFFSNLC